MVELLKNGYEMGAEAAPLAVELTSLILDSLIVGFQLTWITSEV